MKMKLIELIEAKEALDKVLNASQDIKLSYRVSKIATKVIAEMKHFETIRNQLFVKYGEKQEDGNFRLIKENIETYRNEWEKFLEEEIEFDAQPIPFVCLKTVSLSGYEVARLGKFIEEPKEGDLAIEEQDKPVEEKSKPAA